MVARIDATAYPELDDIVRRLVDAIHPVRIYLFGSRARHEATGDSDYDLLVLIPDCGDDINEKINLAYDVLWGAETPVDVIVQTTSQFESRAGVKASLAGTVLREGALVYETE
jgi:uncharacterized protein